MPQNTLQSPKSRTERNRERMKNYRLYLVRHGITAGNLQRRYVGGGTDEPLCEQGLAQLRALAAQYRYPWANTVFASPMKRALGTAEVLFPGAENKIILEDLRESHFGEFENRSFDELREDAHFKLWLDPAAHYVPEGGEAPAQFHARCAGVLRQILEYMMKAGVEEAACVTHGGVIMSMLAQRGIPKYPPELWMADAGCGYLVQASPELLMRDGIVEVTDIVPFGYLE